MAVGSRIVDQEQFTNIFFLNEGGGLCGGHFINNMLKTTAGDT